MFGIDPITWTEVSPLLDEGLGLSIDARQAWLDGLRSQRPSIAAVVADLLTHHDRVLDSQFLEAPPLAAGMAGMTVGAYTLDAPLGMGGMGTVWRARRADGRFEGVVAVKLLHVSALDAAAAARFAREGTLLARLSHPNIARLYDAGITPAGQPYLVLQIVEGRPIDECADALALDVDARLALFLQVCDAVAHAHVHLVVHRDIKPSNILVDRDAHVTLLDFGIAQLVDGEGPAAASTGALRAFTPEFAAPEQVRGDIITTATDIYALGVLLYVLLTDRHPTGDGVVFARDHARAVLDTVPRPASSVAPARTRRRLTGDLDAILTMALHKVPGDRYHSVAALAADLRRHLGHEPVAARARTPTYVMRTFVRRHRTSVGAAVAVFAALAAAVGGIWMQGRQSARDRDFALLQLARAEATIDLNEFLLTDAAPLGRPFTAGDLLTRAEALLNRHPIDPPDAPTIHALISVGLQFQSQDEDGNARRVLSRAFDLAQQLPASQTATRAMAGCALAGTLARGDLDELRRAQALVAESLRLLPAGRPFALDRARCERSAAIVARHAGDGDADIAHVETAGRLLRESGLASPEALLATDLALAGAYRTAGRMTAAEIAFRSGFEQLRRLGRDQTERAGTLLNDWGLTLMSLGRPRDADWAFSQSVAISRADASDASVSPMLLLNAARPVLELGREDEAIAMIDVAIAEAKRLDDQVVQLQALLLKAGAERQRGRLDRAAALFDDAEVQLRQRLPPGHGAFASLTLQRANIALARGQLLEARRLADEALAKAEAVGPGDELVSGALLRRAQIEIAAGDGEGAVADARRAVEAEVRRSSPGQLSSRLGRMYLTLAEAQRAAGLDTEMQTTITTAVQHLEATLGPAHLDSMRARRLAVR